MAISPSVGASASDAVSFTLSDAGNILHQQAYSERVHGRSAVSRSQYSVFCDHIEALITAQGEIHESAEALRTLARLIEADRDVFNLAPAQTHGLIGLILPLADSLDKHVRALAAALPEKTDF